jgi:CHAT domain-containing protein
VLARAGLEIHEKLGTRDDSIHVAFVRRYLADALLAQERPREALIELDAIRIGLRGQPEVFRKHYGGDVGWEATLLDTDDPDGAIRIFRVALERAEELRGEADFSVGIAHGAIAMAYRAKGDHVRALAEFRSATRILLNPTGGVTSDDEERPATLGRLHSRILVDYITLLAEIAGTPIATHGGLDAAAEAFRIADVARGRSVQEALAAAAARAVIDDRALSDLVRQEQDARKRVTALEGTLANLLSTPTDRQDQAALTVLRREVEVLRRARRTISVEIKRRFPAYAQLIDPPPMTVDQGRATLRRGEALISTYVARDRTFVWAIPHTGSVTFAVAPLGDRVLEQAVRRLRAALDPNATTLDQIPAFDVGLAHDLYRQVLEPVKAGWETAERLLIVPHGPLGHLPFSVLVTQSTPLGPEVGALFSNYQRVPWLVRTHSITVLPSVTSLATLRALPLGDPSRRPFVGFGDPVFSKQQIRRAESLPPPSPSNGAAAVTLRASPKPVGVEAGQLGQLPRLPETAEEIRSIARAMNANPTQDVFLGVQANERVVRSLGLSRYRVIVFATHGLVPGDLVGLTQPALALTAPEVAQIEGDGRLTMDEILGLRLNADWVVLSACNTASGNGAGSEAISGLGRAFFYAGARALLVSNWPVETTSAKWLTTELFRLQSEDSRRSRAEALRQTQNALIDLPGQVDPITKQLVHSYAHPIFWAPFVLVGDGG